MTLSNKLAAEFIGTFWLVLGGCGSTVLAAAFPQVGIGSHAQAFGQPWLFWVAPIVGTVAYKAVGGRAAA